jgi:hypothetical protein
MVLAGTKTTERNPNSRVEGTSDTRIRPERGDSTVKHGRRLSAIARVDGEHLAGLGDFCESFTVTYVNVAQLLAFHARDRGAGDTDGCDGEECGEEVSGEQHRRWIAKSEMSGG